MAINKDRHIFYFKGHASLAITYFAFGEDKELCVVEILNENTNISKPWRESNHENK